ncbi:MAG: hypothetical protein WC903_06735 [Candidatus Margulisiibacteriota bacterium]
MTLAYDLGEMKSESGASLKYEVETLASELALKMSKLLSELPIYQKIEQVLPSDKTIVFFQKSLKTEIYQIARDLCVAKWQKRNKPTSSARELVFTTDQGIFALFRRVWDDQEYLITFKERKSGQSILIAIGRSLLRFLREIKPADRPALSSVNKPVLAVAYAEGLNLERRSDFVWLAKSRIDPGQVLVYFEGADNVTGRPVAENVLDQIEKMGMRWVSLNRGSVARKNAPVWRPGSAKRLELSPSAIRPGNSVDKWIMAKGKELLLAVNYWRAFYQDFNVKINFIIGEGGIDHIPKTIAFAAGQLGLAVGKQRSELFLNVETYFGYHVKDVFFSWTPRSNCYLSPNLNKITTNVVTGYPNDLVFKEILKRSRPVREKLRAKGAAFVIALFDNVFGPQYQFSKEMMEKYYLAFINWALKDESIGIIIKTKKPQFLADLGQVLPALNKLMATGRCFRFNKEIGRLPVDAAAAGDMAVGIGISTAVIESAIAGCRGIHCDLTKFRSHEFYKWGEGRLIFDDVDKLIAALKKYKNNRGDLPDLGDWTKYCDKLDPYRDGRAGERMGSYLRSCLDGLAAGESRAAVLKRANKEYTSQWGADKIIAMENN